MKQRTVGYQNAPYEMTCLISEAVTAGDPNVLYIIPSTPGTLKSSADWVAKGRCHVVGLREHFRTLVTDEFELLTPVQFLAICRDVASDEVRRNTVIFTDQFVSAECAPLLVHAGGKETFYSSLELIATAQYGFAISCWDGASFSLPVTSSSIGHAEILRMLGRYYEACEALGESWLVREHQYQRTLKGRIEEAKNRLRIYQSIVMLSTSDGASIQAHASLLEELSRLHKLLPKS